MNTLITRMLLVKDTEIDVIRKLALITSFHPCSWLQVCLVAYLGLIMLCVSYQVDERTCIQFAMKVSCHFSFSFIVTEKET